MIAGRAPARCPLCQCEPERSFRLSNGAWLWRCCRCGLAWWRWDAFEPRRFYDRDYFQSPTATRGYADYATLEPGLRRTARGRLRRIAELLAAPGTGSPLQVFDIGCGTGCFLDEARRAGWQVSGCEVSAYAAERARQRGLDVTCCPVERLELLPNRYDCVTLWDVIEHLPDPVGTLGTAGRALRPGGVLALSTGDITSLCARLSGARWHLFSLPEHLFFFSPTALRKLLAQAGCRVRRVTREVNWVPISYVAGRLCKSAGGRSAMARIPQWLNRLVPATLGDVSGVYALRAGRAALRPACLANSAGL